MKVIRSLLEEELANSLAMKDSYERELEKLRRGSLVKKKIKGHDYYYLQVREEGKGRFHYLGKLSKEEIAEYDRAKKLRAQYRKLLSEVNKQIKFLRRAIRGAESV